MKINRFKKCCRNSWMLDFGFLMFDFGYNLFGFRAGIEEVESDWFRIDWYGFKLQI